MISILISLALLQHISIFVLAGTNNGNQSPPASTEPYTFCCLAFDSYFYKRVTVPVIYTPSTIPTGGPALVYKECSISYGFEAPCGAHVLAHQSSYPACGQVLAIKSQHWSMPCKTLEECQPFKDQCNELQTYPDKSKVPASVGNAGAGGSSGGS